MITVQFLTIDERGVWFCRSIGETTREIFDQMHVVATDVNNLHADEVVKLIAWDEHIKIGERETIVLSPDERIAIARRGTSCAKT